MTIIMGLLTLIGAGTLFLQLGALAQGTANPAILAIAAVAVIISITYWERRRS